ncbi:MAG: hypothetical protein ACR2KK_20315 [Acidimicrobiales bacterium]
MTVTVEADAAVGWLPSVDGIGTAALATTSARRSPTDPLASLLTVTPADLDEVFDEAAVLCPAPWSAP